MTFTCPKGHASTDPDYCSECGAAMQASVSVPTVAAPPGSNAGLDNCPDCLTARLGNAEWCEVCRYNFVTKKSFAGLPPPAAAAPVPTPIQPAAVVPGNGALAAPALAADDATTSTVNVARSAVSSTDVQLGEKLKLRIVVDATLYTQPSPETACPVDTQPRTFHLDLDEHTLGRQYEGKGIHPEIVINDPGISRRHIKFVRLSSGGYSALELGSSNGTLFNGAELGAGVETLLHPGDQLTLGMWTRITVEAR